MSFYRSAKIFVALLILAPSIALAYTKADLTRAKKEMIAQSIRSYSGNCPCPYNSMKNGRACGGRSAYSRPGGESPLCFEADISDKQATDFLKTRD